MEEMNTSQQNNTLKSIIESYEMITHQPQKEKLAENTTVSPQEKEIFSNKNMEITKLKKQYTNSSKLVKRQRLELEKYEADMEERLDSQNLIKKKLKILSQDKAILISRIGFLNEKVLKNEGKNNSEIIKNLSKELRIEKNNLIRRENEYNLSLIQSEKLTSEVEMWKKLFLKANETLQTVIKNAKGNEEPGIETNSIINSENFLETIMVREEDFISKLSLFEKTGDVEVAQKVFENDLKKLREILDKENHLEEELSNMKTEYEEREKEMDEKYSSLLEKYQKAKDQISKSEHYSAEKLLNASYTKEDVTTLIKRFIELKEKYFSLKETLKNYTHQWTKNLSDNSKKDHEVIKLKKTYKKLEQSYTNLEKQLKEKLENEIEEKVEIREKIIEDQGFQIQNLLYQNHKLRQFIHDKTGEYILPMDHKELKKSNLKNREDKIIYSSIEEQVEQIKKLRSKLYLMSSRMEDTIEKQNKSGNEGESNSLLISSSYSHPYNSLLKRYQKSKKEVLKLQKDTSTWKETTQKLLSEKSELQTKYRNLQNSSKNEIMSLRSKVESYENLRNDLLDKLSKTTSENSGLEIDRIESIQKISKLHEEIRKLQNNNKELKNTLDKIDKQNVEDEKIWDKINIVIESPELNDECFQQKNEVLELLQELREEMKTKIQNMNSSIKKEIIVSQFREHCIMLENNLKNSENEKKLEIEKIKNFVKSISSSLQSSNVDDFINSISLNSELHSFCPTILCLKLNKMLQLCEQKYEKLRGEMLDQNTINKEKELENTVKKLSTELSNLQKAYDQELKEKSELMKMIEGKDKGVYDAIKFKKIIEENKDLKLKLEELKFDLIKEKSISQSKVLDVQENLTKITTLSTKISKLHDLRNQTLQQLKMQKTINEINSKKMGQNLDFLKSENSLLKIKIEKMVEGIKHLKEHMYNSLTEDEKRLNQKKLSNLDVVITNISQSMINVKKEYQSKSFEFNKNVLEKVNKLSNDLKVLTEKNLTLSEENNLLMEDNNKEICNLMQQIEELKGKNKTYEKMLEEKETNNAIQIEEENLKNIGIDKLCDVFERTVDVMERMKKHMGEKE